MYIINIEEQIILKFSDNLVFRSANSYFIPLQHVLLLKLLYESERKMNRHGKKCIRKTDYYRGKYLYSFSLKNKVLRLIASYEQIVGFGVALPDAKK